MGWGSVSSPWGWASQRNPPPGARLGEGAHAGRGRGLWALGRATAGPRSLSPVPGDTQAPKGPASPEPSPHLLREADNCSLQSGSPAPARAQCPCPCLPHTLVQMRGSCWKVGGPRASHHNRRCLQGWPQRLAGSFFNYCSGCCLFGVSLTEDDVGDGG